MLNHRPFFESVYYFSSPFCFAVFYLFVTSPLGFSPPMFYFFSSHGSSFSCPFFATGFLHWGPVFYPPLTSTTFFFFLPLPDPPCPPPLIYPPSFDFPCFLLFWWRRWFQFFSIFLTGDNLRFFSYHFSRLVFPAAGARQRTPPPPTPYFFSFFPFFPAGGVLHN